MAVHSRYGRHYLKDILCSTDLWRGRGPEEFILPHLLQHTGELVHINTVVFSYSLSKIWWKPNLESGRKEICDDPSSVRSGTVSCPAKCGTWSHGLRMRGHTISSLQRRPVKTTVKQETRLWRGSWTTTAWSWAQGTDTMLHGCSSLPESREFWLYAVFFGPKEIHAT